MEQRIGVDSNTFTYLANAMAIGYDPEKDSPQLREEKIAMLRILLYIGNILVVPTIEEEYRKVRDEEKLKELERLHTIFLSDAFRQSPEGVKQICNKLKQAHKPEIDRKIYAECVVNNIDILLTYDADFLNHLATTQYKTILQKPSEFWLNQNIPKDTLPKSSPHPSNPLSRQTFWRWETGTV